MAELEGGTWGSILLGLATIGAGAGWAREKFIKTKVESANADAAVAAAEGAQTVYKMMEERLSTLEKEMQGVRMELSEERQRSRKLELHIFRLESLMRKAGIDPPVFEG